MEDHRQRPDDVAMLVFFGGGEWWVALFLVKKKNSLIKLQIYVNTNTTCTKEIKWTYKLDFLNDQLEFLKILNT